MRSTRHPAFWIKARLGKVLKDSWYINTWKTLFILFIPANTNFRKELFLFPTETVDIRCVVTWALATFKWHVLLASPQQPNIPILRQKKLCDMQIFTDKLANTHSEVKVLSSDRKRGLLSQPLILGHVPKPMVFQPRRWGILTCNAFSYRHLVLPE